MSNYECDGNYTDFVKEDYFKIDKDTKILTPMEIKAQLDLTIIGQEHAKRAVSIEIYKHYLRIKNECKLHREGKVIRKSNILMTGLTGCGKTEIARTLAKILDVPFAIADCTTLTSAGYVGEDVENILLKLIISADYDIQKAERGIIYIDELDKSSRKSENPSITRDVSGEGVQQALLKILEGTIASVPPQGGRKHPSSETIKIDTTNILFIGSGSFEGIEDIVKERLNTKSGNKSIGFNSQQTNVKSKIKNMTQKELRNNITIQDIKKFGMIPELLGRFSVLTNLEPLELEDLVSILKIQTGYIEEYKTLFELQGKSLEFTDEALEEIARISLEQKTGARGLSFIIEKVLMDIMYEAPSNKKKKYIITEKEVKLIYNDKIKISKIA